MQQPTIEREREVSPLRERLKSPVTYLALLALLFLLMAIDASRDPGGQLLAKGYIGTVHAYQSYGRPLLEGRVQCRYAPSCSDYSVTAVRRHGILRGLVLTGSRLSRCRRDVAPATSDPVP